MYVFDGDAIHRLSFRFCYLDLVHAEPAVCAMHPAKFLLDPSQYWDEWTLQQLFIDELIMHKEKNILAWKDQFGTGVPDKLQELSREIQAYLSSMDFHPSWFVRIETDKGLLEISEKGRQLIKPNANNWRFWDIMSRAKDMDDLDTKYWGELLTEWVTMRAAMQTFIHPKMYQMQEHAIQNKIMSLIQNHFGPIYVANDYWRTCTEEIS